jgi:hypothetical protein
VNQRPGGLLDEKNPRVKNIVTPSVVLVPRDKCKTK